MQVSQMACERINVVLACASQVDDVAVHRRSSQAVRPVRVASSTWLVQADTTLICQSTLPTRQWPSSFQKTASPTQHVPHLEKRHVCDYVHLGLKPKTTSKVLHNVFG